MVEVVKLEVVVKLLRDEAEKAGKTAVEYTGVDEYLDAYYQGLRNGYTLATDLLEKKSKKLA